MENPISGDDIKNKLSKYGVNVKIITYYQLEDLKPSDLLNPKNIYVLLYNTSENFGHWCTLFLNKDGLNFFDSYGLFPDDEMSFSNYVNTPLLDNLLLKLYNKVPIEYNNYQFQEFKNDIQTCGKHVIIRLIFRDLSSDEYKRFLDKLTKKFNLNYDQLIELFYENL